MHTSEAKRNESRFGTTQLNVGECVNPCSFEMWCFGACQSLWRWHKRHWRMCFFMTLCWSWSLGSTIAFCLSERKSRFRKAEWILQPRTPERPSGTLSCFITSRLTIFLWYFSSIFPSWPFFPLTARCVHGHTRWDQEGYWVWAPPSTEPTSAAPAWTRLSVTGAMSCCQVLNNVPSF